MDLVVLQIGRLNAVAKFDMQPVLARALSERTCPRPDQAFLQRLIDYGIATGYLGGRTVQRTSG